MAKVRVHRVAQLLKSLNLIYICLGRFLYAVGPSELRFFVRPACTLASVRLTLSRALGGA